MDLTIEDLRFERDGRVVLDVPALRLRGDRTTAILGPNGAGKTTLLRLVAALETPLQGRIVAGDTPVASDVHTRQRIAYVFQEQVFLRRSVRENLELALRIRRVAPRDRHERIGEAAHLLRIAHLLDRRADRLSGGEGRRAGLARALCLRAPLVLLDEPLAGLDPATYARLLDELPQVLQAFNATTLLVTHDRDEALRLGEDLVVLADGRVHAAGAKRDVVLHPRTSAIAAVLGYTVLEAAGRRVAIPRNALTPGSGRVEFSMLVEDVVDLVDRREIVGLIGGVRVHVTMTDGSDVPRRGDRVIVHTNVVCEVA
jgi:ABC-type sugar transport system ATPase subunit